MDKRTFLKNSAILALGGTVATSLPGSLVSAMAKGSTAGEGYSLPELDYAYDALDPHIDAMTMEFITVNIMLVIPGNSMQRWNPPDWKILRSRIFLKRSASSLRLSATTGVVFITIKYSGKVYHPRVAVQLEGMSERPLKKALAVLINSRTCSPRRPRRVLDRDGPGW